MVLWESEDLGFCLVKVYAQRRAQGLDGFNENRKVFVGKESKSNIKIGVSSTFGATAIHHHRADG
jgi:hypothetical protein